jgi:FkbM family methyltransferase
LSLGSLLRLRDYELRSARGEESKTSKLVLNLKRPIDGPVALREVGSDWQTLKEVLLTEVYRSVVSNVARCDTIIDLGANIGLASLYLAARYPSARILAVEPNPSSFDLLMTNLRRLIASGRCQTLKAAVWGSETILTGGSDSKDHFSTFATRRPKETERDYVEIPGVPIAKIIADSGFARVDLMKVDIEGAEVELFSGELSWLQRVRAIAIEFHDNSREMSQFDGIMREYGFDIVDEGPHTVLALQHV